MNMRGLRRLPVVVLLGCQLSLLSAAVPCYSNDFEHPAVSGVSVEGIRGKGRLYTGQPEGKLLQALDAKCGTLAFWVCARGYSTDTHKAMVPLLEATKGGRRFSVYRYMDVGTDSVWSGRLIFLHDQYDPAIRKRPTFKMIATPKPIQLDERHWQFVTLTWDVKNIQLFFNGKKVSSMALPAFRENPSAVSSLALGDASMAGSQGTIFDELKLFARVLREDEVYRLYERDHRRRHSQVSGLTIGRTPVAKHAVDGIISGGEYAADVEVMFDISNQGRLADSSTRVALTYTDTYLQVGIQTPGEKLASNGQNASICWDDGVEIHLQHPASQTHFQWIVNSQGRVYSLRNQDDSWSVPGFKPVIVLDDGTWTTEVRIRFADLGVAPPMDGESWRLNVCRTFTQPQVHFTALGPSKGSYASGLIPLKFKEACQPYQIRLLGRPYGSSFRLQASQGVQATLRNADGVVVKRDRELESSTEFKSSTGELELRLPGVYEARAEIFSMPKQSFHFQYLYTDVSARTLHVGFFQPLPLIDGQPTRGIICLKDFQGRTVCQNHFEGSQINGVCSLPFAGIPAGEYQLQISLADHAQRALWTHETAYRIYSAGPTPWHGVSASESKLVPPPYVPIRTDKQTISVLGRTYVFSPQTLLPCAITSCERNILRSPMTLTAVVGGAAHSLKGKHLTVSKIDDTRAMVTGQGTLGALQVRIDCQLDFDGLAWFKLSMEGPEAMVQVSDMKLSIPLCVASSTLRNFCDYKLNRSGTLPQDRPSTKNMLEDIPCFWLGGYDVGMQFCAESLRGFQLQRPQHSLVVSPSSKGATACVNIIDDAMEFTPRTIEFGLMATPLRPLSPAFRNIRMWKNVRINFNGLFKLYNYPDASLVNPARLQELVALRDAHVLVAPYMASAAASPHSPEYRFFGDTWRLTPAPEGWDRILPNRSDLCMDTIGDHYLICPCEDYVDFYVQKMMSAYKTLKLKGWYGDWADVRCCDNALHGHGWTDWNGKRRGTWNILGMRNLHRRVYTFMKSQDPKSLYFIHSSGTPIAAAHGFCDIFVDGENLASLVGIKMNYFSILPLDRFQAGNNSRTWGWTQLFLPQFTRIAGLYYPQQMDFYKSPAAQPAFNHLMGLILVSDSLMHNVFGPDMAPVHQKLEEALGWDEEVVFIPYWHHDDWFTVGGTVSPNAVISLFRRRDKVVLVAFNNMDSPHRFEVTLKPRLDIMKKARKAQDILSGELFDMTGGRLVFSTSGRAFRILNLVE